MAAAEEETRVRAHQLWREQAAQLVEILSSGSSGMGARKEQRGSGNCLAANNSKIRAVGASTSDAKSEDFLERHARESGNAQAAIASPNAGIVLDPWFKSEFYGNVGYGLHSKSAERPFR